jgi:hypothetical protein
VYDGETAGPADLLTCRELDLKEAQRLELPSAGQRANVEGVESAGLNSRDESRFSVGVIAGDENRGCVRAYFFRAQCGRKVHVERLDYLRRRQRSGDVRGERTVGWYDQRVERLKVERIGDVDDDLAGELLGILFEDVVHGRVIDGEDDDVAGRAQMDLMLKKFSTDQQIHRQTWSDLQGPIPSRLYHYTTIDGLFGITSTGSLWVADVRFMNDSSELSYAISIIDEVIDEVLSGVTDQALAKLLPNRSGLADIFELGERPFIACFCKVDDLLSQWRGYGADKAPVSLGLDLSTWASVGLLPKRTFLRKVIYDREEQRRLVRAVVETWLGTIKTLLNKDDSPETGEVLPYPAIWALQEALLEHHLCFKHPAFSEEQEWRLIKLVDVREEFRLLENRRSEEILAATRQRMQEMGLDMPEHSTAWAQANAEGIEIKFRRSALGLVPYVELPLLDRAGVFTGLLPLWEVVQGPTSQPELSAQSLGMFLESRGYGFHTKIKLSGIPLRP